MIEKKCRVCKSTGETVGLLFKCFTCSAVHWDKPQLKKIFKIVKKGSEEFIKLKNKLLNEAQVPKSKGKYVYTLRLRGKIKYLYVGMTGLHPYHRYLNHVIGYKSSKYAKKYATTMIEYEGPMKNELAIKRECDKGNELRAEGFEVEGAPFEI